MLVHFDMVMEDNITEHTLEAGLGFEMVLAVAVQPIQRQAH